MTGMRSWISATSSFESVVMMAAVRSHSPEAGSFQFSQIPAIPNGAPSFMAIAYGCLALWHRLPFEKAVDRHNAAAPAVRIAKCRKVAHGLAFGVDRLSPALGVVWAFHRGG